MSTQVKNRFKDIVLHADRIPDWTDPALDADVLSGIFMGPCDYWDDEEFEGLGPHEIEKEILLSGGRDQWWKTSPYGKPYYQHFLTLMKVLFPKTDITPSLADAVMFFCCGFGFIKILNLIGCQNSSKSASAIRIPFVCMYIDPHYTVGYVANPFENAADSTVWGDIEELWDELCEEWPLEIPDKKGGAEIVPSLFPKGRKYAKMQLVFVPDIPKAGKISIRHVKDTGKLKGSKSRKGARNDVHRGFMFVLVDEINEIKSMAFLDTLENISSQDAFFSFTSQNFKDETDMGGQITNPVPRFEGCPSNFEELDMEIDQHWPSAKQSWTLRFDGHRAPNILAGKTIYQYLIKQKDLDRLAEGGTESFSYYSQARSFPIKGGLDNTVLTAARVSASRHNDTLYQLRKSNGRGAFCDPAFGGRDNAVYAWGEWGDATVMDNEGNNYDQELLIVRDNFEILKIARDAKFDDHWDAEFKKAGVDTSKFTRNEVISPERQVALQCRLLNLKHNIPAANFGYDFSMRPDIVTAMIELVGAASVAFDYNQKPEGHYLVGFKQQSEDYCHDRVSELAFLAADLFITKQIRCGNVADVAIMQLQRTYHEYRGKKRMVEKKAEYKVRWNGRSPDHRDTFVGLMGMAVKRGFRKDAAPNAVKGIEGDSLFSQLNASGFAQLSVKPAAYS